MKNLIFENFKLSEDIIKSTKMLGYEHPTDVQSEVIPLVLDDNDIIVKSQTGSGKTAAFAIPVCEKINIDDKDPQALIIAPTRELSVQIKEDITNIGRYKKIRCASVFGKQPISIQERELKQRVHVIAGTPGRIIDHIERGNIVFSNIKYLVIDEADKMLEMGFIEQVEKIINAIPSSRVTLLFSATMPEKISDLCKKYMKNPMNIEVDSNNVSSNNIVQIWYEVDEPKKYDLLNKIIYIENPDSCIIFCRTKENVDNLSAKMKNSGFSCRELHGGMLQNDRLDIMKDFKKGEFSYLVATDIAARGIDINNLSHIVNYDVPLEKENYVHRIGRTGRAGNNGKAVTFVTPYEKKFLNDIENYIGFKITQKQFPSDEEVEKAKSIFLKIKKNKPQPKIDKSTMLNRDITKIYINAGKKKKISAGDIVGALSSISGVNASDIGIIDIQENISYIDILSGKGDLVLTSLLNTPIKGRIVKAQRAIK